MNWLYLADGVGSLIVLAILVMLWLHHFRGRNRIVWRCVRWQGGGQLESPRPMTLEEVTRWLARDNNAEIGHVDLDHGFIFYRPRG